MLSASSRVRTLAGLLTVESPSSSFPSSFLAAVGLLSLFPPSFTFTITVLTGSDLAGLGEGDGENEGEGEGETACDGEGDGDGDGDGDAGSFWPHDSGSILHRSLPTLSEILFIRATMVSRASDRNSEASLPCSFTEQSSPPYPA